MRMSEGRPAAPRFPIRFAVILFAIDVPDSDGGNPKPRRVVVLTPDAELAAGSSIVVAAVTGTLPPVLTSEYVLLPYKNPPGSRHPRTGLTKRAAVHCTRLAKVVPESIAGRSGDVPPATMALVRTKTEALARAIGGW